MCRDHVPWRRKVSNDINGMYIKHQLEQTISQSSPSFSFGWDSSPSIQNFETHKITQKKKKKNTDLLKSNGIEINTCMSSIM